MNSEGHSLGTLARPHCPFCDADGELLHEGLQDRLFGAPGVWSIRQCANESCGCHWIDPMVLPEELGSLYDRYYTHEDGEAGAEPAVESDPLELSTPVPLRQQVWRAMLREDLGYPTGSQPTVAEMAAVLLLSIPFFAERLRSALLWTPWTQGGRLLDVGCGSGEFLVLCRGLGWNVVGVEPDPKAAERARSRGIEVHVGELSGVAWEAASFDRVTMAHVIEHVPDPLETLERIHALLRPHGTLTFVTPSVQSLGARKFGRCWRGWETPRHLHLGGPGFWAQLAERAGFEVVEARTTAIGADWIHASSSAIQLRDYVRGVRPMDRSKILSRLRAQVFRLVEFWLPASRELGEECVVTVRRPGGVR